jgi:hypothetical protein
MNLSRLVVQQSVVTSGFLIKNRDQ